MMMKRNTRATQSDDRSRTSIRGRLNAKKVTKINRLICLMNFVSKGKYFKMNTYINFDPVKGFENRRNVRKFWTAQQKHLTQAEGD